jgi:hypothetical protein
MADIPRCKNKSCERSETLLIKESQTEWVFACKNCGGLEVRTKPAGWRAGEQHRRYQRYGRPEYDRKVAYFILGRHS